MRNKQDTPALDYKSQLLILILPSVFYFASWLNILDRGGKLGVCFNLGYRTLYELQRNIFGGWVSMNLRDTGAQTFIQLAAGFEFWAEARGFLPVGETRPLVGSNLLGLTFLGVLTSYLSVGRTFANRLYQGLI
ncbi:MAG: hypothetical protein ACK4QL_02185 [Pseudanabaenaceae cyanobacterium]